MQLIKILKGGLSWEMTWISRSDVDHSCHATGAHVSLLSCPSEVGRGALSIKHREGEGSGVRTS